MIFHAATLLIGTQPERTDTREGALGGDNRPRPTAILICHSR